MAAADALEDVRIKGDDMRLSPLKSATPEAAEDLAKVPHARLHRRHLGRVTRLLCQKQATRSSFDSCSRAVRSTEALESLRQSHVIEILAQTDHHLA